jgi:hypothetical protein
MKKKRIDTIVNTTLGNDEKLIGVLYGRRGLHAYLLFFIILVFMVIFQLPKLPELLREERQGDVAALVGYMIGSLMWLMAMSRFFILPFFLRKNYLVAITDKRIHFHRLRFLGHHIHTDVFSLEEVSVPKAEKSPVTFKVLNGKKLKLRSIVGLTPEVVDHLTRVEA